MERVGSQKSIEIESLSFSQYAQRGTGSGSTKLLQHWSYGTGDVKARCSGTVATVPAGKCRTSCRYYNADAVLTSKSLCISAVTPLPHLIRFRTKVDRLANAWDDWWNCSQRNEWQFSLSLLHWPLLTERRKDGNTVLCWERGDAQLNNSR
jgi:hypothetical protein